MILIWSYRQRFRLADVPPITDYPVGGAILVVERAGKGVRVLVPSRHAQVMWARVNFRLMPENVAHIAQASASAPVVLPAPPGKSQTRTMPALEFLAAKPARFA